MVIISIKKLRNICQGVTYDYKYPLIFRIMRLISIYPTWVLIQFKTNANNITLFGIISAIGSGVALYHGSMYIAFILIFIAIIADFSDGEVSRYFKATSKEGTYLDKVHHIVVQSSFLAGVILWSNSEDGSKFNLALGIICILNSLFLPIINMYAVDIALLKHVKRALNSGKYQYRPTVTVIPQTSKRNYRIFLQDVLALLTRISDFPYVIFIFSIGIYIDYLFKKHLISDVYLILGKITFFYAVTSGVLIIFYLTRIVKNKHIEKKFNEIFIAK